MNAVKPGELARTLMGIRIWYNRRIARLAACFIIFVQVILPRMA